jgi:hypothetical protein
MGFLALNGLSKMRLPPQAALDRCFARPGDFAKWLSNGAQGRDGLFRI